MARVLVVVQTNEYFRLSDQRLIQLNPGSQIDCLNALVWKGRGRSFKRVHDRRVVFTYDPTKHQIRDVPSDAVEAWEVKRAKELMCHKYHPHLCMPRPFDEIKAPVYTSVAKNRDHWIGELARLSGLCLEYLQTPGKFDRTKLSVMRFELSNVLSYFGKTGDGGSNGGEGRGKATPP